MKATDARRTCGEKACASALRRLTASFHRSSIQREVNRAYWLRKDVP